MKYFNLEDGSGPLENSSRNAGGSRTISFAKLNSTEFVRRKQVCT